LGSGSVLLSYLGALFRKLSFIDSSQNLFVNAAYVPGVGVGIPDAQRSIASTILSVVILDMGLLYVPLLTGRVAFICVCGNDTICDSRTQVLKINLVTENGKFFQLSRFPFGQDSVPFVAFFFMPHY
jgi:hypothetical protein